MSNVVTKTIRAELKSTAAVYWHTENKGKCACLYQCEIVCNVIYPTPDSSLPINLMDVFTRRRFHYDFGQSNFNPYIQPSPKNAWTLGIMFNNNKLLIGGGFGRYGPDLALRSPPYRGKEYTCLSEFASFINELIRTYE